jgi:hypothetical protein
MGKAALRISTGADVVDEVARAIMAQRIRVLNECVLREGVDMIP